MVQFGGKPSRGCQACRRRKIRCEPVEGGCVYCRKTSQQCTGRRDEVDIMFRDETVHIAQKVRKSATTARRGSTLSVDQGSHPDPQTPVQRQPASAISPASSSTASWDVQLSPDSSESASESSWTTVKFVPNYEDLAMGFFVTFHTVNVNDNARTFVPKNSTVIAAAQAVGLAGLSSFTRDPGTIIAARKKYSAAIQGVNQALMSPATAVEDSTLVSITLLSQVEAIDSCTKKSMVGWENHIKGSSAVLKMRGFKRLKTPTDIRLFMQTALSLSTLCLRLVTPLPEEIYRLAETACQGAMERDPSVLVFKLQLQVTKFYVAVMHGEYNGDVRAIITKAMEFEKFAQEMFNGQEAKWSYRIITQKVNIGGVEFPRYHEYKHFMGAQTWNGCRSMRLILQSIMRGTILRAMSIRPELAATFEPRLHAIHRTIKVLQEEMFASAPQLLMPKHKDRSSPLFPWTNFNNELHEVTENRMVPPETIPMTRGLGGYSLPWSLYLVGKTEPISHDLQVKILSVLRYIGQNMGLQQSLTLAEELEKTMAGDRNVVFNVDEYDI